MHNEDRNPAPKERATDAAAPAGPATPPNARAIFRVSTEFLLRSLDELARLLGNDLIRALVYSAMWTANVKHITSSAGNNAFGGMDDIPPDDMRKPVSALALANSLRIPYETVRRTVQAMIKAGLAIRVGNQGLIVPAAIHGRREALDAVAASVPSLLRFLADLKRAGFDFAPYKRRLPNTVAAPLDGTMAPNARAVLRVCSELVMRGIDTMGRVHNDDFLAALIFTAIWTANVSHITDSPDNLAFGGLRDIPPDELRKPVTVNAIAGTLRIPYETVRRYTARMIQEGSAIRIEGKGLIIPRSRLAISSGYESIRLGYAHVARAIADMHRAGFDFSGY